MDKLANIFYGIPLQQIAIPVVVAVLSSVITFLVQRRTYKSNNESERIEQDVEKLILIHRNLGRSRGMLNYMIDMYDEARRYEWNKPGMPTWNIDWERQEQWSMYRERYLDHAKCPDVTLALDAIRAKRHQGIRNEIQEFIKERYPTLKEHERIRNRLAKLIRKDRGKDWKE